MEDRFQKQWDSNADAFASLIGGIGTPHHQHILNPCIDDLLGDVKERTLLDAGCGEGYLARYYAEKGAVVTAIDLSPKLIETAIQASTSDAHEIDYRIGDVCHLDSISDQTFDVVLSNLVLLNIPCLQEALREYYRVLKHGGHLVFSIVHPAFNFYGPGTWEMGEKDPETKRRVGLYFKVDHYFDEKEYERYWRTRDGEKFPEPISFFHRTLSTYLNAIVTAGLKLVEFREPVPTDDSQFFERERRIPFFAVFKAQRT